MLEQLRATPRQVTLPEGRLEIWDVRPGLVFTRADGRMLMEHADHIINAVEQAAKCAPGDAGVVHDWLAIESYEVAVHARMTTWSVNVARSLRRVVIGVRSPLVALAVRTVNLAVGGRFEVVSDPELLRTVARQELERAPRFAKG